MKQILLIASLMFAAGCSDVERADWSAMNTPHRITLYATDGHVIKTWDTDGLVRNAYSSDGVEFKNRSNDKLVRVSGTVVVETL
jgi:hypothetical protein